MFRPINHKPVSVLKEEKMFRKLVSLLIALSFLLIGTGIAFAAEKPQSPTTVQQPTPIPVPVFVCPSGWHKKPGASYVCVPNKPAPSKCPKGYEYFEQLTCIGTGGACWGCEVGCKIPPPK